MNGARDIQTWCDGFGWWHAKVEKLADIPQESSGSIIIARKAIREEILEREQRTGESFADTAKRLGQIVVIADEEQNDNAYWTYRETTAERAAELEASA